MIKDVVTIRPDALLEEAGGPHAWHDISCLVVTEGRKVVGIITQNDIFEAFIDLLGGLQTAACGSRSKTSRACWPI